MKVVKILSRTLLYLFLIVLAAITLLPLVYVILGSFRNNMGFMVNGGLIPNEFTLENYKKAFSIVDFGRNIFNSLVISGGSMLLSCLIAGMTGFVFSRKEFKGKKLLFSIMLGMMFISLGGATLYPKYKLFLDVHLKGTYLGMIIAVTGAQTTNSLLVKSFLDGISKELDEAAIIDGCGIYKLFFRIIFPILAPMLVVVGIMQFKGSWNEYLFPMLLAGNNQKIIPISVAVVAMKASGKAASEVTLMLAGVTMSILPMLVMFVVLNKYFVEEVTVGAVKG